MGKEIFVADHCHFGIYCCRVVVPGMSEIYPIDDLLLENNSLSIPARRTILSPNTLTADTSRTLYEFMEGNSFPREQPISNLTGILFPVGSLWENLCVGEFNTLLCLASKDAENAILWSEWCSTSPILSAARQNQYRCIYTLLRTENESDGDSSPYHAALKKLYGEEIFSRARRVLEGKNVFDDLQDFTANETSSPHAKLLDAYRKCQSAKSGEENQPGCGYRR
jgi:ribosomal protein S12 methylthiotransferase accessory factor